MRRILLLAILTLALFGPRMAIAATAGLPDEASAHEIGTSAPAATAEALSADDAIREERKARYDAMPYPERMKLAFILCVLGMVTVFIVLSLLALAISWLNQRDLKSAASALPAHGGPVAAEGGPIESVAGLQPEVAAVIVAAVTAALRRRRFAIRSVKLDVDPSWGRAGRQQVQSSHNIERKH